MKKIILGILLVVVSAGITVFTIRFITPSATIQHTHGFIHYIDFGIFDGQAKLLMTVYGNSHAPEIFYEVYLSSSEKIAKSKKPGDIAKLITKNGELLVYDIDDKIIKEVHTTIYLMYPTSSTIANTVKIGPEYGYLILGNLTGTYNEGIPYKNARLDLDDAMTLRDSYYTPGIRFFQLEKIILPMTKLEVVDIVKDGHINVKDYNKLKSFGVPLK